LVLGPRAQEILKPYLDNRDPGLYLFSPREGMENHRTQLRAKRKTKVQPSQLDRSRPRPQKRPGIKYSVVSYDRAVATACQKAGVTPWTPNQLRHSKATEIRREAGLDAARAVLGHRSPAITEVYAEVDEAKASAIMERLG
jgi:integrase